MKALSLNLESADKENTKLKKDLTESQESISVNLAEKLSGLRLIELHEAKINELTSKLAAEIELKNKLVQQNDLLKEITRLREMVNSLEKEKQENDGITQELQEQIQRSESTISSLEQSNSLLELERDVLKESSTDLAQEIEYLKGREGQRGSSCSSFSEYVTVKRELVSVKEENNKLKTGTSRTELKTLKADGTRSRTSVPAKLTSVVKKSQRHPIT